MALTVEEVIAEINSYGWSVSLYQAEHNAERRWYCRLTSMADIKDKLPWTKVESHERSALTLGRAIGVAQQLVHELKSRGWTRSSDGLTREQEAALTTSVASLNMQIVKLIEG